MDPNTQLPVQPPEVPLQDTNSQAVSKAAGVVVPSSLPTEQAVIPSSQPSFSPAPTLSVSQVESPNGRIEDDMKKRILKIISGLTIISILSVVGIFLLTSLGDASIKDTVSASNSQASYLVPSSWQEDTNLNSKSYSNGISLATSQAVLVAIIPVRLNFNSELLNDNEISSILDKYEALFKESTAKITINDRQEVAVSGFYKAYDYTLSGLADDGLTELRGRSRVLFDANNFMHTIEFIAVTGYWNNNEDGITTLFNSYTLRTDK